MRLSSVPAEHVLSVWGDVAPFLQSAIDVLEHPRHDIADLLEGCLAGRMVLWVFIDGEPPRIVGAFVTASVLYPQCRALAVLYMGGHGIRKMAPEFKRVIPRFARQTGHDLIEFYGRDAWRGIASRYGARKVCFVFEASVDEGEQ